MRYITRMLVRIQMLKHKDLRFSLRLHLKKGVTRVRMVTTRHAYYKGNSYVEAMHPQIFS